MTPECARVIIITRAYDKPKISDSNIIEKYKMKSPTIQISENPKGILFHDNTKILKTARTRATSKCLQVSNELSVGSSESPDNSFLSNDDFPGLGGRDERD